MKTLILYVAVFIVSLLLFTCAMEKVTSDARAMEQMLKDRQVVLDKRFNN